MSASAEVNKYRDIVYYLSDAARRCAKAARGPERNALRWNAIWRLFTQLDQGALQCSDPLRFRDALQGLIGQVPPTCLELFFRSYLAGPFLAAGERPGKFIVKEAIVKEGLLANAWYLRAVLDLDDDRNAPILIVVSTDPHVGTRSGSPTATADGEAQAAGPLFSALVEAYPTRRVRTFVGGGPEDPDAGTWRDLVETSHIITLGGADSNPTRREILKHSLTLAYQSVITGPLPSWWLSRFKLTPKVSEEVKDFFQRYGKAVRAAGKWSQRFILLARKKADGRIPKNYLFDTEHPRAVKRNESRCLSILNSRGRTIDADRPDSVSKSHEDPDSVGKSHEDYGFINLNLPHPWNPRLKCFSFAGTGTFFTGSGALIATLPQVTKALVEKRHMMSIPMRSRGGARDLDGTEVFFLE